MKIPKEVVLDLMPLYLAGEADPVTEAFVRECLSQDEDLAERFRKHGLEAFDGAPPAAPPPELELRALRRTRRMLSLKRWLFGFGILFATTLLSFQFTFDEGGFRSAGFVLTGHPILFGTCAALALASWTAYFLIQRPLRAASF